MASQLVKRFRQRELRAVLQTLPEVPGKGAALKVPNPFVPRKNPVTGRWAPPKYSLRRQAELIKAAKTTNTLHLLPAGPKLTPAALHAAMKTVPRSERPKEVKNKMWARHVSWTGKVGEKDVKGADVGNRLYAGRKRMFKGHRWQRTMEGRVQRRRMLMKSMKRRVLRFKSVSSIARGRCWSQCQRRCRFTDANVRTPWPARRSSPRCPSCRSRFYYFSTHVLLLLCCHCISIYIHTAVCSVLVNIETFA